MDIDETFRILKRCPISQIDFDRIISILLDIEIYIMHNQEENEQELIDKALYNEFGFTSREILDYYGHRKTKKRDRVL